MVSKLTADRNRTVVYNISDIYVIMNSNEFSIVLEDAVKMKMLFNRLINFITYTLKYSIRLLFNQGCRPCGCRGCHGIPRFWQIS